MNKFDQSQMTDMKVREEMIQNKTGILLWTFRDKNVQNKARLSLAKKKTTYENKILFEAFWSETSDDKYFQDIVRITSDSLKEETDIIDLEENFQKIFEGI